MAEPAVAERDVTAPMAEPTPGPMPTDDTTTTASSGGNALGRRLPGVLAIVLAVLVAAAVLYPVGRMIARAVGSGSPTEAFTEGDFGGLLGSTVLLVVASGLIALAIGSLLAWLNERTDARMGALTDNLPLVPFFLPPIAGAIGWVFLLSPKGGLANAVLRWALGLVGVPDGDGPLNIFTWYGLIGVLAIYLVPYVYMMVSAGLRNVDPRLEEQARVSGSRPFRTALRVTLPACKPSLGGAILLLVWVGMSEYSVPAVIGTGAGIDVFSVRIAKLLTFKYPPELGTAFGLCLIVMVVSGCVWLLQRRSLGQLRFSTLAGKGHGPARLSLGGWKWVARAAMGVYLLLAAVLPLLALVLVALNSYWSPNIRWGDLGLDTFRKVLFDDVQTRSALGNSIELAVLGATIGVALAAVFAVLAKTAKGRLIMVVDAAAKLPAAVPSMIMAIGISVAFGGSPFYLSGTVSILLATYVMVGLPEATVAADAAAAQVGNELVEASTMAGGGTTRTFWRVYLPLMVPGLIIGWAFLFIRIMGDLNASVILAGTNNPVVGFYIYSVYTGGNYSELAGLASILCVISLVAAGLVAVAGRHLGIGRVARAGRRRRRRSRPVGRLEPAALKSS